MLSITKIISKTLSKSLVGEGKSFINIASNGPLSSYMKPLSIFNEQLNSRQAGYDALITPLANTEQVMDDAVDIVSGVVRQEDERYLQISADDASNILSGFSQASEILSGSNNHSGLSITSGSGVPYSFSILPEGEGDCTIINNIYSNGSIPFMKKANDNYYVLMNPVCVSSVIGAAPSRIVYSLDALVNWWVANYDIEITDGSLFGRLNSLCASLIADYDEMDKTIQNFAEALYEYKTGVTPVSLSVEACLSVIVSSQQTFLGEVRERLSSILSGLIISSEINGVLSQSITSILSGHFNDAIANLNAGISSKSKAVKLVINNLGKAFSQGGLKGAIMYILSYAQSSSFISGESGLFEFTDNSKLRPREYIAGIIGTIVATAIQLAALVVAIFSKVVGVLFMVLGTVMSGITNSFKYDETATRAALLSPEQYSDNLQFIGCLPVAMLSGTSTDSKLLAIFRDLYDQGSAVWAFDVIGGMIIMGPGGFSDSDSDLVTSVRWEFHPSAQCLQKNAWFNKYRNELLNYMVPVFSYGGGSADSTRTISVAKLYRYLGTTGLYRHWVDLMNDQTRLEFPVNNENGSLSQTDDGLQYSSACFHTLCFMLYCMMGDDDIVEAAHNGDELLTFDGRTSSTDRSKMDCVVSGGVICFMDVGFTPTAYWSDLVAAATAVQNSTSDSYIHLFENTDHEAQWVANMSFAPRSASGRVASGLLGRRRYSDAPWAMPVEFKYCLQLPSYNAQTFWLWIIATVAVTAIVTAAVVCASVKISKAIKAKRASNIARFNAAQGDYQDAINGEKKVYNPETHQYDVEKFDVNSDEGKAYINSCFKNYKTTALKNNLWANVIGGSRYDVSSFWGEAATDDSEDISSRISSFFQDNVAGNAETDALQLVNNDEYIHSVYKLICGREYI